ncbi:hypothetical protein CLIM01_04296 [Colletotrichum limetticola]|uniref:Uncharacterized protein n=1 Tax=Colletotrichum limetticola TaxID=1209924 RepID=A0ABQ9Q3E6_9PEZI|nr:hypothetical protein CLIM01_04296 [Colletotrichum limetticola]
MATENFTTKPSTQVEIIELEVVLTASIIHSVLIFGRAALRHSIMMTCDCKNTKGISRLRQTCSQAGCFSLESDHTHSCCKCTMR